MSPRDTQQVAVTPLIPVIIEPGGVRYAPGVQTIAQAGLPYEGDDWFGVLAPAGTPLAMRAVVSKEMARILALPELRERLQTLGAEPVPSAPAEFETMVREYIARVRRLGDAIGMKAE